MLSIIINVKNGERYLEPVLRRLSAFDDVVLVDNYSTDNTVNIANKFNNIRIYQHHFCGMGKLRNIATDYAKYDWVLIVDSDEILDTTLINSLLNMQFESGTVYALKRHNYYANKYINSSAWENDWVTRLYNRKETKYTDTDVHEAVITQGVIVKQINAGVIYHFPYVEVSGLISKMQAYSSWYAKQNYGKKKPRLLFVILRSIFTFVKCYFVKRGFMDGFEGLVISSYNAIGVLSKYMKLYELYYKCNLSLFINFTSEDQFLQAINLINRQKFLPSHVFISVLNEDYARAADLVYRNLYVPYSLVDGSNKDSVELCKNSLQSISNIDCIYLLLQIDKLNDSKYLEKIKNKIIRGYQLPEVIKK